MKTKTLVLLACMTLGTASESINISGKVQYEGRAPKPSPISMTTDAICGRAHEGGAVSDNFLINDDKYMQNVVVWINNPKHSATIPENPVILDQTGCMYSPRINAITAGQNLMIKNSDKTLHNVHSMSELNSVFNVSMPPNSDPQIKTFTNSEDPFYIKCDVHPWMKTWMVVLDHPYWAVTDKDGNYSINTDNLEPGTYDVCFWHENWDRKMGGAVVKGQWKEGVGYCSDEFKTTIILSDQSIDAGTKKFIKKKKKK